MLALAEWEAGRCQMCGGDPGECQSPDADRNNPQATWIFQPALPVECHRTTASRLMRQDPNDHRALIPRVVKLRRGEPAPQIVWRDGG